MSTFRLGPTTPRSTDDATPVGSLPRGSASSARRVRLSPEGEVLFGAEEPIYVAVQLRTIELRTGRTVGTFRLEAKAHEKADGPRAGDRLIVSEAPYGNGWTTTARFRRGLRRARVDRARVQALTLEEAQRELAAQPHDPWETGAYVTAGIEPPGEAQLGGPLRSYGRAACWVFGVCEDVDAHAAALIASFRAQRLLDDTMRGRLRIVRPSASRAPVVVPVHASVRDDAHELLLLSIRQALAGPAYDDATEQDAWTGRPVLDLVERLYRDHLHNRTRTWERRERRKVSYEE